VLGALVTPVVLAPLEGGVLTAAPELGDVVLGDVVLGDVVLGEALLGAVVVTPVLGEVLGVALGGLIPALSRFGEGVLGIVLGGVISVGVVVFGVVVLGFAAVSAIAPPEVVVVTPVLDFFEVSLGVVCCAAAGIDSAASRTAASAYRYAMMLSPARCLGVCRLFSTDSHPVTAQTMHTALRMENFTEKD
jgi:hypothetical protein